MKTVLCILFLGIMVGIVGLQSAQCETTIVNGVEVDEFGLPVDISSVSAPLDAPNQLDFTLPCLFRNALPVSKYSYKHLGFKLKGNGAVLDECGTFGITGYSPPNFLAFACNGTLADGKTTSLPLKITFNPPVRSFSYKIGSGLNPGEVVTETINKKSTRNITLANNMPTYAAISMEGPIFKTLEFKVPEGSGACIVVIDDIESTP